MNEDDKRKDSSNDEEEAAEQAKAQPAEAAEQAEQGEPDTETALAEAEARAEENWNQFLRARAEMENLRRRAEKDVAQARQQSLEKLAGELLAVKDSLEMGVQTARSEGADITQIAEGSELTLRMFNQALEKFRIEEINPEGERFDPACHEAMAAQPAADAEPNTVLNVVQKGYRLGERLLRPAMVIVAKAPEENGGEG
ncbi:heat shock protein GrpE [Spiribacter salinus M19-40]|jgi:molecular chaperone GrpE|uniref:Protein GrpE n=1 Tax=Spiribacter salinus M19-40 TaxID=1260251 RepID=R4V4X7_9GAMM|nr:nucleotide exchange factor GrpE [Spiribacter salinus]AGM41004.1 heat shock protein GrpE [Spiribacter salinus M19-40]MBY5268234.1 nucleotide exchange factor GrpE [Spiribacter salinus]